MTFNELVTYTMGRLNLTSDEARQRIGGFINSRYKKVTSSIGLITSRRDVVTITVDPSNTATFPDLPELTVNGLEKIDRITTVGSGADPLGILVLKTMTYDEITNVVTNNAVPRAYAIKKMGPGVVTIVFDSVPTSPSSTFPITCYGYAIADILADDNEPFLPTDFHDILIEGAMADELRKMEKPALAQIADGKYENRLSDLRMFIAKEAYLDIYQGKNRPNSLYYNPWNSRVGMWN